MQLDPGVFVSEASSLNSVLSYDSIWTSYAGDSELAQQDPFAVFATGLALRGGIETAPRHAHRIAVAASDDAGTYWDLSASLVEALSETEAGQTALDALSAHDQSVAALAEGGAADLLEGQGEALEILERDARQLLAGRDGDGYLPDRFLCGLAKTSMAAGLITVWVPPHAHAAAAVGLGAAVYKAGRCADR
jgi:hypothetical protein